MFVLNPSGPFGLAQTVTEFNQCAREGRDGAFRRGESAFDRYYGDPSHGPNPNLGTLERPPFYAVPIHPGSMGTKGGPKVDVHGRVLHVRGGPIEGLYAAGNVMSAIAGHGYPGPGITIGTAMTWGYLAARHAAGRRQPQNGRALLVGDLVFRPCDLNQRKEKQRRSGARSDAEVDQAADELGILDLQRFPELGGDFLELRLRAHLFEKSGVALAEKFLLERVLPILEDVFGHTLPVPVPIISAAPGRRSPCT